MRATARELAHARRRAASAWRRVQLGVLLLVGWAAGCAPRQGTIGAILGQQPDGRLFVRDVPEGLAADRAGLRANDEIISIDGRDVRRLAPKDLHQALSGEVGDRVKLTALRGDQVHRATVVLTPARRSRARVR